MCGIPVDGLLKSVFSLYFLARHSSTNHYFEFRTIESDPCFIIVLMLEDSQELISV